MKYKTLIRRVTLLVFNDHDSVNYTASCQININGVHGTIDTLIGNNFYKFLAEYGYKPFRDLGLIEVSAAVTESHLRLLKTKLKNVNIVVITEIEEPEEVGPNLKLHWIRMTEKSPLE